MVVNQDWEQLGEVLESGFRYLKQLNIELSITKKCGCWNLVMIAQFQAARLSRLCWPPMIILLQVFR